jgi:hypothetical protein
MSGCGDESRPFQGMGGLTSDGVLFIMGDVEIGGKSIVFKRIS